MAFCLMYLTQDLCRLRSSIWEVGLLLGNDQKIGKDELYNPIGFFRFR